MPIREIANLWRRANIHAGCGGADGKSAAFRGIKGRHVENDRSQAFRYFAPRDHGEQ